MRINHKLLRKAALVALTITSVAATSGIADAGFTPSKAAKSDCFSAESFDVSLGCSDAPEMLRSGIRW